MSRAVLYLRVSTDEQAESGLGLEAQEATTRAWCASRGHEVVGVYRDEGVSGRTPVDRRRGLAEALAALGRGAVLVAARRDRLAREVYQAAIIEEAARRAGATVETPDAPTRSDPWSSAMRGMLDVFAELERALVSARTRGALAAKRARGERTGGEPPYGWRADGVRLVEDRAEQRVIRYMRRRRALGDSLRVLVARLRRRGVPCRGRTWHVTTVHRILRRETPD